MRFRLGALLVAGLAGIAAGCGGSDRHADRPPPQTPRPRIDLNAPPAEIARRSNIPILCYHQIRPQTAADAAVDRPYIMPPRTFRAELATRARRGYHTISPEQLLAHLTTGAALPPRPVMLTFDDSVDDQYRVALPELRRRHMTATFFVMTVVLGNEGYMTRREVRRLDREGMAIAAHTWDHHRVDEYAGDDWRIQIDEPTRDLARLVGHPIRIFAYPFGVWSRDAFPHLREAGLQAAFQLTDQPIAFSDPLMTIRRKIADPAWSTAEFVAALRSGFRKVAP